MIGLIRGFIRDWILGKLNSCEDGFVCLVLLFREKFFLYSKGVLRLVKMVFFICEN